MKIGRCLNSADFRHSPKTVPVLSFQLSWGRAHDDLHSPGWGYEKIAGNRIRMRCILALLCGRAASSSNGSAVSGCYRTALSRCAELLQVSKRDDRRGSVRG